MSEDYLLFLIRRAASLVGALLAGRSYLAEADEEQEICDSLRLAGCPELAIATHRTPVELVALLAGAGDALFAERGLVLAAALTRLSHLRTTRERPRDALVCAMQARAIARALRACFGPEGANPLDPTLSLLEFESAHLPGYELLPKAG